jgi:hypothetical protein
VHVNQTCGGKFGVALGEGGREGPLVVIIAVDGGIVDAAHVNNSVAFLQLSRITGANKRRGVVGR